MAIFYRIGYAAGWLWKHRGWVAIVVLFVASLAMTYVLIFA